MNETFSLFARPSFLEGLARIFDIGNTLSVYNDSDTELSADFTALKSDWAAIAADYWCALEKITKEKEVVDKLHENNEILSMLLQVKDEK